jgi:catechol 2,3-dioxygenase-like lactoylglutathione lyase family enzyme
MHPKSGGLLESSLYVNNVAASAQFYRRVFGFSLVTDFGERGCALRAGDRQILLLFKKLGSLNIESPHDGDGQLHVAFATEETELPRWESWLSENDIAITEKRIWDLGGQSIYFRDPDGHLLELVTPGVWPGVY